MEDTRARRPGFSRGRRWAIGLQMVVSALSLFAIVIMINYLAARHPSRTQWAPHARHQLSPLSRALLGALTNDVKITVLYDPAESSLFTHVRTLLDEYVTACPRLDLEYVNYGRSKGRADDLLAQYKIVSGPDSLMVILEATGQPAQVVRERELSVYDYSGAFQGEPVRRVGFNGEQFFTSKLQALADGRPIRAYLLTGHGEPDFSDPDSTDGLSRLVALLEERNTVVQPLTLETNAVPEDCQLLIIAGPRYPLPPAEVAVIDRYLRSGGRSLILLKSAPLTGVPRIGLESMLTEWGVDVREGFFVMDPSQAQSGNNAYLLIGSFGSHRITDPLRGARVGMVMPQAVMPAKEPPRRAEGAQVAPLLLTSPAGMLVRLVGRGDTQKEEEGVIPIAVAVERGAVAGVSLDRGAARLVVVGDATFVGNQYLGFEANRDFVALAVNWLLDRHQLLEIGPRPIQEYQINLTRTQMNSIAWALLGVLPGGVLTLGLVIWLRRRR